jgi:hypothetical protein
MRSILLKSLTATLIGLTICAAFSADADVVCHRSGISGFDQAASRAKQYVSATTNTLQQMKVYVSVENGSLYLHSNYKSPGFEFPTKLETQKNDYDIPNLTFNLVGKTSESELFDAVENHIVYYVDQNVFENVRYRDLDFADAKNVTIVDRSGKTFPSLALVKTDGSRERIIELRKGLYVRVTKAEFPAAVTRLHSQPFSKNALSMLSLTTNTATNKRIDELFGHKRVPFDFSTKESLLQSIIAHKEGVIIALGHIEKGSFVVLDAGQNEVFSIPVKELEILGMENDVKIIPFGCESANATDSVGLVSKFNTVSAVDEIYLGSSKAHTYGDFFEHLADKGFALVIDDVERIGSQERVKISIYSDGGDSLTKAAVATLVGSVSFQLTNEDDSNEWKVFIIVTVLVVSGCAYFVIHKST